MSAFRFGSSMLAAGLFLGGSVSLRAAATPPPTRPFRPNVILCMADDLGWGDTGYNGNLIVKTPCLDQMAREGLRFDRWYAGAPVCSPTRGSCLTGRHPYRYGIFFANRGHLPRKELTLAEALRAAGYATGHFGKWHLGTLTAKVKDSNRGGPKGASHYSPPWDNGFDTCFSTEAKVPTFDPMRRPKTFRSGESLRFGWVPRAKKEPTLFYGTRYWTGPDQPVTEGLEGDDSALIMDRALEFIRRAVGSGKPFFAVIWFHAPHLPVSADERHRSLYQNRPLAEQLYYGAITAMDEQVGRLRAALRKLGAAENTMLWFCSDNGPEVRTPGSAGLLRGRKRSLYEGGVRVPGLLVWPAAVRAPRGVWTPCSTLDYAPTVLDFLGIQPADQPRPTDGVSLRPLIEGKVFTRPRPIPFESGGQVALIGERFKLCGLKAKNGSFRYALYDIERNAREDQDVASAHPDVFERMRRELEAFRASCRRSLSGADYR